METQTSLAQRAPQRQYPQNASEQASNNAETVLARLRNYNFGMSNDLAASLQSNGISAAQIPMVVSTCVAAGVSPALLSYRHNIPAVVRVMQQIIDLGYRAGEDFHTSVFSSKTAVMNEYGEPTQDKVSAPTLVVMQTAARALENMRSEDRLDGGIYHHLENGQLEGDEAKRVFDQQIGNSAPWGNRVIVAYVDMYTYVNGQQLGSGKPVRFYGFFLPQKYYNNVVQDDTMETGKVKLNYTPFDIAVKRATVKAARSVTKTNFARDDRPVDVRKAALTEKALSVLYDVEHKANRRGISIEQAFSDDVREVREVQPEQRAMMADRSQATNEDGDILFTSEVKHRPAVVENDSVEDAQFAEQDEPAKKPADIINDKSLGQPIIDFIVELRGKETPGAKFASPAQYQYVVGITEEITGKGTHTDLLSCIFGRPVSAENPISIDAAKHIFKCLGKLASRKDDESGKWVKYDNPDYDETKVSVVSAIGEWISK